MDVYSYLNAVIDANPSVTRLALTEYVYVVAAGPVPAGQVDLSTRVTVERGTQTDDTQYGFDAMGAPAILFRC